MNKKPLQNLQGYGICSGRRHARRILSFSGVGVSLLKLEFGICCNYVDVIWKLSKLLLKRQSLNDGLMVCVRSWKVWVIRGIISWQKNSTDIIQNVTLYSRYTQTNHKNIPKKVFFFTNFPQKIILKDIFVFIKSHSSLSHLKMFVYIFLCNVKARLRGSTSHFGFCHRALRDARKRWQIWK